MLTPTDCCWTNLCEAAPLSSQNCCTLACLRPTKELGHLEQRLEQFAESFANLPSQYISSSLGNCLQLCLLSVSLGNLHPVWICWEIKCSSFPSFIKSTLLWILLLYMDISCDHKPKVRIRTHTETTLCPSLGTSQVPRGGRWSHTKGIQKFSVVFRFPSFVLQSYLSEYFHLTVSGLIRLK